MKPSKADIFLIGTIILVSLSLYVISFFLIGKENGAFAEISVDGEVYKTVSLSEDCEFDIEANGHINRVKVEDNCIKVVYSDCSDLICVNQGEIDKTDESIVCLPNRVVITVKGAEKGEYDAIVG